MKPGPRSVSTLAHIHANVRVCENGCHVWQGGVNNNGYGVTGHADGVTLVHRHVYAEECGPLEPADKVLHTCDNPPCCNPEHLVKGTQAENVQDMHDKGRHSANRKRTPELDAQIRKLVQSLTYHEAAAQLGVSRMTVVRSLRGHN